MSQILLFTLLIYVEYIFCGEWNTKDYMKREHSLIKPYYGTGLHLPFWDFYGSTIVTANFIRLTPDMQSKIGILWNNVPVQSRNWEIQVHFKVHGKGKDLFGDGFALWYAKDRMIPGPVFGNIDYFHGLVVIFDTYSNHNGEHAHQHPYISAMVNNGSLHYDHDRDGTHTQLAGCEVKFRNVLHDTYVAVRYEGNKLTVSTDLENKAAWKSCLEVNGVQLPTGYFIGLTATTGDLSDNHEIVSVRFFELDLPNDSTTKEDRSKIEPSAQFFEAPREHIDDPKTTTSSVKTFMFMLIGALLVVACIILAVIFYQKHQEDRMKRFY